MYRAVFAALSLLVVLPVGSRAQTPVRLGSDWDEPRLRITPFVAYTPPVTRTETRYTRIGAGAEEVYFAEVDLGTGFGGGANFEYRFIDQFAVFASGSFIHRNASLEYSDLDGFFRREQGSNFIMSRAGFGYRLQERESQLQLRRLDASVYAGPSWIVELPLSDPLRRGADPMHLFGGHVGIDAELPLSDRRFALYASFEDNFVWWNRGELGRRADAVFTSFGQPAQTRVTTGASHMLMLRLGMTARF
jgi:hypothetical protein